MKRSKSATSSSSRPMPRNKQMPQPPQVMSNIENDLSFGNGVAAHNNNMTPSDNDYNNARHYSQKQQHLQSNNNHHNFIANNSAAAHAQTNMAMQQQQSQQYVQINQGGQVTRQQQHQLQQQQQHRQDVSAGNNSNQLEMDRVALIQKNQRLAKELSDLRVKHREETKVVSRLTMENMNLASRCRQAISEMVDLKRKLGGYEKRHRDFGNLQKEVLGLRRQIERQHGGGSTSSSSGNNSNNNNVGSSRRRNRSTSPKAGGAKRNNGSNDGGGGSSMTPVDEKKKKAALVATAAATTLETKGSSETTDLDRIMAQELFKRGAGGGGADNDDDEGAVGVNNVSGSGGVVEDRSSSDNALGKKDGGANAVTKKFKELQISTATANSTVHGNINKVGGSKASSSSTSASTINATTLSKRSTAQSTSSTTDNGNNNNTSSATNAKIPISVTSNSATQRDEDEFDAEIGMVDFFAKPSKPTIDTTTSISSLSLPSSTANDKSSNNTNIKADVPPAAPTHTRTNLPRKMKKTETDDHMPEELVGSGALLSPSAGNKKNVGDNLLSSLDAFEASFASAFPETSFSLKSEAPSSTQHFDVPVFDPFFKSPVNKDTGGSTSTSLQTTSPRSKSSSTSGAVGGGSSQKDGMKSQLKDLFPDSALTTSPNRGLDLAFDSTFPDMDIGISSNSKSSKGKSLSSDKLDNTFSRSHSTTPTKTSGSNKATSNRTTPLDMSAEIEQLDALASAPEKAEGVERKRSVRKVKTPLSYAEPSTKQKLRRGDVLFPKIDADRKLELEAKRSKNGGISPTTDLDRIMSEHFSVNSKNNKKDGTLPS